MTTRDARERLAKIATGNRRVFIDSFSYRVASPSGKQVMIFEDSDHFGPSKVNMKTGNVAPIEDRVNWFWAFYTPWRAAGRPTVGEPISTPCGPLYHCAPSTNPQDER